MGDASYQKVQTGASLFSDEVNDEGLVEDGKQLLYEGLVILMRKVRFQALLVLKGDDKAMGVSLSEVFGAHVGPPLVAGDGVDLGRKSSKGLFDGCDLILGGVVLELEADHMAIDAWFCCGFLVMVGERIGTHKCKRKGEGEEEDLHDRTRVP